MYICVHDIDNYAKQVNGTYMHNKLLYAENDHWALST